APVREYLRPYAPSHTFSNALSPSQCATVLAALKIVRSSEGETLRQSLLGIAEVLRNALATAGLRCLGKPGPLVPAFLGPEGVGRITAALCFDNGVFANLVEYPAVSVGMSRFRMQVMATHTPEQARLAAEVVGWAYQFAKQLLAAVDPGATVSAGA